MVPPVNSLLFIPWFKAEPIYLPLPFTLPGLDRGLPIQPFGVLVAIGVLLGIRLAEEFAERNGMSRDRAYDFAMYTIVSGFIGAFVLNVVMYDPQAVLEIFRNPSAIARWSGLSSYGGFYGAAIGILIWKRKYKTPAIYMVDSAAFGLPFGWIFGRMGCFIVHDHPGRITDFFLAVDEYHVGLPPYYPRHDLGLYEVLWAVMVSGLFLYLWRTPNRPAGFYTSLLIVLYAPVRFFLDFLRAEADEGGDVRYFGLTPGQYSSLFFLGLGLWVLRRALTEVRPPLPEELRLANANATPTETTEKASTSASAPKGKGSKKKR